MKKKEYAIGIDIGNTTTRVVLVDIVSVRVLDAELFPTVRIASRIRPAWKAFYARCGASDVRTGVSCVAPLAGDTAMRVLKSLTKLAVIRVRPGVRPSIPIRYDTPRRLGTDRLCAAIYCARRFTGKACAIISAGTAVTVDYLAADGGYEGGAILPGASLQFQSLAQGTAALPHIRGLGDTVLPGRDTAACIKAGVAHGLAGAVEHIVALYRRERGVDIVLASGGAWPFLAPLTPLKVAYEPYAAAVGAALFATPSHR